MTDSNLVLTFDIGTQSTRALLVKSDGTFEDTVQIKYEEPYFSKAPNQAEQHPDFYFENLCKAGKEITGRNPDCLKNIIAVTITTIRDSTLCLDKDMKPLRDIILWLDKREATFKGFDPIRTAAFKLVGMYDTGEMQFKASVCNWIAEHEPDIWEKTDKFVMLPAYLNYKLTGKLIDSVANIIGHVPFDSKKGCWMKEGSLTRCVYDIPKEKLCDLCKPGETVGYITEDACKKSGIPKGLPLIATGSDKGCETLGLSVIHKGKAALSFGTTATIQITSDEYIEPQQFMPAYPAIISGKFNPEIQIFSGYWMLSWFIREFGHEERYIAEYQDCSPEDILNGHLKDVPPGCDSLILQPYWTPGITIPNAKGSVIGWSYIHSKYHLYRAIIEGVGFGLYEAMQNIEKRSKVPITELYIGGGGSQSDEISQITADMFGLPVKRIQTHEACGLGSSIVAFVAMGTFKTYDEALESMVYVKDIFYPDKKTHEIYENIYNTIYKKIYRRLNPIFNKMKKMT
ncbi:MAG: FGGY-family carbohydrate kinase [Clostridiales bacterium]|nr:FGGY-family carbohydrate kinase [Clostridiales bacterium]